MPATMAPMDRATLERGQLEKLRALLAQLAPNPFYARALSGLGAVTGLDDFRARAPFTLKAELIEDQRAHPPWGTNLTFPLERYTRFHLTSASSGAPLSWLDTPESWAAMLDCWDRVYGAAGVERGARIYFAFSFGPFLGFWTAFEAAARRGCLCLPGGGLGSVQRLRSILDHGATALCCTPTYALRLAETARQDGLSLAASRVRALIVAGEPGGSVPATRAAIENAWPGARVHDHHGMTETGPVSYECPSRRGVLHVIEAAYLAEVVDPAGRAVTPGATGELVLTTLTRTGSPLVRYRTGDQVRRGDGGVCACGSSELSLEGGILGRLDDMVIIRGVNVFPSAIEEVVRAHGEVAEYRVQVGAARSMPELHVEVEPAAGCRDAAALARGVEESLRNALGLRVPVAAVAPGALPRFEMKAQRWIRNSGS